MESDLSLVDEFARQVDAKDAWDRSMDFMIAYLSEMKSPLPPVAGHGLEIAKQFRNGLVAASELENARVECWKYLDERSAGTDITTPAHCAVRAVICMLYERTPPGSGIYDLVGLFLEFANRFEDHSDMAESLLRRYFLPTSETTQS